MNPLHSWRGETSIHLNVSSSACQDGWSPKARSKVLFTLVLLLLYFCLLARLSQLFSITLIALCKCFLFTSVVTFVFVISLLYVCTLTFHLLPLSAYLHCCIIERGGARCRYLEQLNRRNKIFRASATPWVIGSILARPGYPLLQGKFYEEFEVE